MIRFVARSFLFLIVIAFIVLAVIWVARKDIAHYLISRQLTDTSLEDARFDVDVISSSQLSIRNISLPVTVDKPVSDQPSPQNTSQQSVGDTHLSIDQIVVTYDVTTLLLKRRIQTLMIGPGQLIAAMDESGRIKILGVPQQDDAGAPVGINFDQLPLDKLVIKPLKIKFLTEEGAGLFNLHGHYDLVSGGEFSFKGEGENMQLNDVKFVKGSVDTKIMLDQSGGFGLTGEFNGQLLTQLGFLEEVETRLIGNGQSWKDIITYGVKKLDGRFELSLLAAELKAILPDELVEKTVSDYTSLLDFVEPYNHYIGEAPVNSLSLSGDIFAVIKEGDIFVGVLADAPLMIESNQGDQIIFTGHENEPLWSLNKGKVKGRISARIDFRNLKMEGDFRSSVNGDGNVDFVSAITLPAQEFLAQASDITVSTDEYELNLSGNVRDDLITLDVVTKGEVKSLSTPIIEVVNASIMPTARMIYNPSDQALDVSLSEKQCYNAEKIKYNQGTVSLKSEIDKLKFCVSDGAFLNIENGIIKIDMRQVNVKAEHFDGRSEDLSVKGRPPELTLDLAYASDNEKAEISGDFRGGDLNYNDEYGLSLAEGRVNSTLNLVESNNNPYSADIILNTVHIRQLTTPVMINPVIVSGEILLNQNDLHFETILSPVKSGSILSGVPVMIGRGKGSHNIQTQSGVFDFQIEDLAFAPDGLQPQDVIPSLLGFISDASGVISGHTRFQWNLSDQEDPQPIASEAKFTVEDFSFNGPGTAVTRTQGITGEFSFSNLTPITSVGLQKIKIRSVDLNALKLENGIVEFSFPGDESLSITGAEFPWFGGWIGAYNSVIAITGERVNTALQARDVDLAQFLDFLDVEGLSGEGTVEGVLPLVVEGQNISIVDGLFRATRPGTIQLDNAISSQIGNVNEQTQLAFGILRDLRFESFEATVNGDLDGNLVIGLVFEGVNAITFQEQQVSAPVIYRIMLEAPMDLILSDRIGWQSLRIHP